MDPRSQRTSCEQFATMIGFMEQNGDLPRPQSGPQGRQRAERLWRDLAEALNSVGTGAQKTVERWKKVWADFKTKTKKKAMMMRRHEGGTGGGPHSRQALTAHEERVLAILGLSAVDGLPQIIEHGFSAQMADSSAAGQGEPAEPAESAETAAEDSMEYEVWENVPIELMPQNHWLPLPPTAQHASSTPPAPPAPPAPRAPVTPALAAASTPALVQLPAPAASPPRANSLRPQSPHSTTPTRGSSAPGRQRPRRRRGQTPFDRATGEFAAVELRRAQLAELHERNQDNREGERLRIEARRVEIDAERVRIQARRIEIDAERTALLATLVESIRGYLQSLCSQSTEPLP